MRWMRSGSLVKIMPSIEVVVGPNDDRTLRQTNVIHMRSQPSLSLKNDFRRMKRAMPKIIPLRG
jgi:hypothetical protein